MGWALIRGMNDQWMWRCNNCGKIAWTSSDEVPPDHCYCSPRTCGDCLFYEAKPDSDCRLPAPAWASGLSTFVEPATDASSCAYFGWRQR